MDTNVSTNLRDSADRRDEAISFERAASERRAETGKAEAAKTVTTPAACGEGWYHDAAIAAANRDAIEARSNPYHH